MPTPPTLELVEPDAEGFLPNGWVDDYPHDESDGSCTGQCCEPSAYLHPEIWHCYECHTKLHHPGECVNCSPPIQPR